MFLISRYWKIPNVLTRTKVLGAALLIGLSPVANAQGTVIAQLPGRNELGAYHPKFNGFHYSNAQLASLIASFPDQDWWEDYKARVLTFLFDPARVCLGESGLTYEPEDSCIPTAAADRWIESQIKSMSRGVCEGMVVSSLALWKVSQNSDSGFGESIYDEFLDYEVPEQYEETPAAIHHFFMQQYPELLTDIWADDVQDLVLYGFVSQLTDSVADATVQWRNQPPLTIYDTIAKSIGSFSQNPYTELYTVGMYRYVDGNLKNGHSVLPYRVVMVNDSVGRVYVYDSNFPDRADLFIEFNGDNQWSYNPKSDDAGFFGNAASKNIELSPLSTRNFRQDKYFECPFCRIPQPAEANINVSVAGEGELHIEYITGRPAEFIQVTDEYLDERGGDTIPFKGGLDEDVPDAYVLPPNLQGYRITAYNPYSDPQDTTDLIIDTAGVTVVLEDVPLSRERHVSVVIVNRADGPYLEISSEAGVLVPMIFIAVDEQQASYEFSLGNVGIARGRGLEIGLSRAEDIFMFGRGRTAAGYQGYEDEFSFIAVRYDEASDYWVHLEEPGVYSTETMVFGHGEWQPYDYSDDVSISGDDLPMYIFETDIWTILGNPEVARNSASVRRVSKHGTGSADRRRRKRTSSGS